MASLGPPRVPESTILHPRDSSSTTNSDDWPEFRLVDAFVTLPDSKDQQPASLLVASEHHPVTVTGRLLPPRVGQEHHWRHKDGGKKGTSIVIHHVRSFAYGSYEDGSVELWAAGQAGWFVIQPSRAYRHAYHDMCAAVKMLFFVVDAHTEPPPQRKGKNIAHAWTEPNAEEIFERYAREELGDEARSAEAAEAVYMHRDFLLSSMLAGKEGISWSKTPLYRHLSRKFADDLKAIRERSAPAKPTSKATPHTRQGSVDSTSTSSSLKRKRGRPPKERPLDVISIGSSSAASSVKKDLPQRPATARSETQQSNQRSQRPPTRTIRRTRNTSQSISPRSPTPEIQESATPVQNTTSDDSGDSDVPARVAGKGKSALRLKPNKPIKGPSRSGKAPVKRQDDAELSSSSPVPSKRRADEHQPTRRSKRRNRPTEEDEGIDMPTSPSTHSSPPANDQDTQPGAPLPPLPDALAAHKPDPLQESTWLCALDSCTHKIYGDPSDPLSQKLIREHYALHAYDDDARVQLVKRLQAPSLPVSHLMERVKVAAKGEGFPGSRFGGSRFPEPVQTKY